MYRPLPSDPLTFDVAMAQNELHHAPFDILLGDLRCPVPIGSLSTDSRSLDFSKEFLSVVRDQLRKLVSRAWSFMSSYCWYILNMKEYNVSGLLIGYAMVLLKMKVSVIMILCQIFEFGAIWLGCRTVPACAAGKVTFHIIAFLCLKTSKHSISRTQASRRV